MDIDEEVLRLARLRAGAHSDASNAAHDIGGRGRLRNDIIGALAEMAFAWAYGFEVEMRAKPNGDGGIDFFAVINGQRLKIDVKARTHPDTLLLVSEEDIRKPTSIYVLARVRCGMTCFLGWEHRGVMLCMPKWDFVGKGVVSHYRHWTQLRPMGQLADLLAMRDRP